MPLPYQEGIFEGLFKKLLLSAGGAVTIIFILFQILNLETILPGSTSVLGLIDTEYAFLWLILVGGILWYSA